MKKLILWFVIFCVAASAAPVGPIAANRRRTSSASTPWVTGQNVGGVRNDYTGTVGYQFTVGASPITVTDLGRWVVSGNSATHVVYLANTSGTSLGSVTVATSGQTAAAYAYATLSSPVTLSASTVYAILSAEVNGGDQWNRETDSYITSNTSVATWLKGTYASSQGSTLNNGPTSPSGATYGLLNFKY